MKVFIINSSKPYEDMINNTEDWSTVSNMEMADVVLFTGGEDVNPALYGRGKHPKTIVNEKRDEEEVKLYEQAQEMGLACIGICRGAQFLAVMNGAKLVQDMDGHTEPHMTKLFGFPKDVMVSSTHHQMMMPDANTNHMVLMRNKALTTYKESCSPRGVVYSCTNSLEDIECVFYPDTDTLCFQPHPELADDDCRKAFFYCIRNYVFKGENKNRSEKDYIPF